MADVKFILDAESAKAVGAFLKVVQAQKKGERGLDRYTKKGKQFERMMKNIGAKAAGAFGGLVGFSAMKGVFQQGLQRYLQEVDKSRQATFGFEQDIKQLVSLGDNVMDQPKVREMVKELSNAWGISVTEIAQGAFRLKSGFSEASDALRDELLVEALRITALFGGELGANIKLGIKGWRLYGDQLDSVTQMYSKLGFMADAADTDMGEMADRLAEAAAKATPLKLSLDEVAGAMKVALDVGGKNQKSYTSLGNVFLKMNEAAGKGIIEQGNLMSMLTQLKAVAAKDPLFLQKLLGTENFVVGSGLLRNLEQIKQSIEDVTSVDPAVVGNRLKEKFKDPTARYAEFAKVSGQVAEKIPLREEWSAETTRDQMKLLGYYRSIGAAAKTDEKTGLITAPWQERFMSNFVPESKGWEANIEALQKGGRSDFAAKSLLGSGFLAWRQKQEGSKYGPKKSKYMKVGESEAQAFTEAKEQDPTLTAYEFIRTHQQTRGMAFDRRTGKEYTPETAPENTGAAVVQMFRQSPLYQQKEGVLEDMQTMASAGKLAEFVQPFAPTASQLVAPESPGGKGISFEEMSTWMSENIKTQAELTAVAEKLNAAAAGLSDAAGKQGEAAGKQDKAAGKQDKAAGKQEAAASKSGRNTHVE